MNSRHLFASALATVFVVAAPVHAQVLRGGAMGAVGGATGGGFGAGRLGGMGNFGGQAGGAFGGDVDTMGRLNHGAHRPLRYRHSRIGSVGVNLIAPEFRLRRASGTVNDPVYAREIARGPLRITTTRRLT